MLPSQLPSIFCIDVGGPTRIGWADAEGRDGTGANLGEALDRLSSLLLAGQPVALGFEAPIWTPARIELGRITARRGAGDVPAQQLGLNIPVVAAALRRVAFPDAACGAGHVRWPRGSTLPSGLDPPFGIVIFLKQALRMEQAAWSEGPMSLHIFIVRSGGSAEAVSNSDRETLLRGLFKATVRNKPEESADLIGGISAAEQALAKDLKRITREEHDRGMRYAVMPLLACVVGDPGRD